MRKIATKMPMRMYMRVGVILLASLALAILAVVWIWLGGLSEGGGEDGRVRDERVSGAR